MDNQSVQSQQFLWAPIMSFIFGTLAVFPYLAVMVNIYQVTKTGLIFTVSQTELSLEPFCLGINGLVSGVLSLMSGTIALFQNKQLKKIVLISALGISLGLLGILANLFVYWFIINGEY